jgi:hypothetical protein
LATFLLELGRLGLELGVGEALEILLEGVDGDDLPAVFLEEAVVAAAEDDLESVCEHGLGPPFNGDRIWESAGNAKPALSRAGGR